MSVWLVDLFAVNEVGSQFQGCKSVVRGELQFWTEMMNVGIFFSAW